jgi:tetratricopeptide (TPR) repeat protein
MYNENIRRSERLSAIDFDSLWDYSRPNETESKFREVFAELSSEDPSALELLTQIARAQGLQRKFEQAHETLDIVETELKEDPSRAKVRYLLERGRALNSSGNADRARPLFERAEEIASQLSEDFYAVDAIHMLAILASAQESLTLNLRALGVAESSAQAKTRNWLGSLYNNTAWSYHDLGDFQSALEMFRKAESWHGSKGQVKERRIATWTVARTLRSMKRLEEALSVQMELVREFESAEEKDGHVFEEVGECLLALNRMEEARPYFAKAHQLLSQDDSLAEQDSMRLQRLKQLGTVE